MLVQAKTQHQYYYTQVSKANVNKMGDLLNHWAEFAFYVTL